MAGIIKKYVIGAKRLQKSLLSGFELDGGTLKSTRDSSPVRHIFLRGIDGAEDDIPWGRLSLRMVTGGDLLLTVRAFASNDDIFLRRGTLTKIDDFLLDPSVSPDIKEQFFESAGGIENSGVRDMLLYDLKGRRLYLWLEVSGMGSVEISNLTVCVPGDNFYVTFPAVYQTDGDFFKRYLSVFSTIYDDFQETIDHLDSLLDIDTASVGTLHHFASWLGLETEGMLSDETVLRKLIKSAPGLFEYKGTKTAIEGIVGIFVSDPFYVIERNLLTAQQVHGDMYGDSPYDFSILINRKADEQLRTCLEFFIDQFKPVRSRYKIVFLGDSSSLDRYTYLDLNGSVLQNASGRLDDGKALTGTTYLQ